jgi:hypothetical protein
MSEHSAGEASMDRPGLRRFLRDWFCGCGSPSEACATLLKLLRLHPLYESRGEIRAMLPDVGMRMLVLYTLDEFGLTEHGSNIESAWLTGKGAGVRAALAAEEADDFAELLGEHCWCGFDTHVQDHDCTAWIKEHEPHNA